MCWWMFVQGPVSAWCANSKCCLKRCIGCLTRKSCSWPYLTDHLVLERLIARAHSLEPVQELLLMRTLLSFSLNVPTMPCLEHVRCPGVEDHMNSAFHILVRGTVKKNTPVGRQRGDGVELWGGCREQAVVRFQNFRFWRHCTPIN